MNPTQRSNSTRSHLYIMKMLFRSLLVISFAATAILAQQPQVVSVIHDAHKISSQVLGEDRTVLVRVPASYSRGEAKYPVVYMLDAHPPQNAMMAGILEQQTWGGVMPEVIIVGIQNTARVRDMTPTRVADRAGSGGGDKFLDYIEKEVIPLVERNYRTQPYRVLAGHSLAGLATINALVSRPVLFNAYVAASPFLHWDKDFVVNLARERFKTKENWNRTVYMALGDEPAYINAFNSFRSLLKGSAPKSLDWEFQQFPTENHGSVVLPAYYAGLRKVFAGWQPPAVGNLAELESHYKKLSERFGYSIPVPEDLMNRVGYELLNANRGPEAIDAFKKNVANFPRSSNTYDSLGEAYEKTGNKKSAKESYEKAHAIALEQNDAQRAAIYKANLDRVTKP